MANLKFTDTHNMVAFLSKPAATVNREVQLQALVDGKKIIITESTVRRDLQLEDVEGVDCLPNATIFKQLTLMGHKRIYVTPSHTKKIFGNMKSVGKGFSGRVTPLFPRMVVHNQEEMGEGSAMPTNPHHIPNVVDEAINEEMNDSLVRATTTASSLEAEQDSGNIDKTQFKATPNKAGFQGTTLGGGPRRQEIMGDTTAQTRFESITPPFLTYSSGS
ncbi:hypothetical protein Tco_1260184 [Tanacetum coccineum]